MGIVSGIASLGTGLAHILLDVAAGMIMLVGTVLMLFDQWLFGGIIFFVGCCALVLAELFWLLNLVVDKNARQSVGIIQTVLFAIGGYFFVFLFVLGYVFLGQPNWCLVLAITSAVPTTIKLGARVLALPLGFFK